MLDAMLHNVCEGLVERIVDEITECAVDLTEENEDTSRETVAKDLIEGALDPEPTGVGV